MFIPRSTRTLVELSLVLLMIARAAAAQTPNPIPAGISVPRARPTITITSPTADQTVPGVAIVRFQVENVRIVSLFDPTEQRADSIPAGHVHVTVDGAQWHWVHSTSDPVVITPLSAGQHTVTLELAGADHRPLDSQSVRFTVVPKESAVMHHDVVSQAVDSALQPKLTTLSGWELGLPSGALLPTGALRRVLKDADLSALQLSYAFRPRLALTTMLGWARSRDVASDGKPRVDVFSYDVGAELRGPRAFAQKKLTFSPFLGAGAGARSYNYRTRTVDATHNVAAYGTVGGEAGLGRVRLRLEVRDYVTGFKPLVGGGPSSAHNDVVAMFGLRIAKHAGQTSH